MTTIRKIQDEVCAAYGIRRNELMSRRRSKMVVRARHEAIRRARAETEASYADVGMAFDRCHTAIMYVCGALTNRQANRSKYPDMTGPSHA